MGKSGCIRAKGDVIGKKWLYSGRMVVLRQKWFYFGKSDCI